MMRCFGLFVSLAVVAGCSSSGTGQTSLNMKLVGTNDLQSRSSYQVLVNKQGGKYIAYVGHHTWTGPGEGMAPAGTPPLPKRNPITGQDEDNGTSMIDVTDPTHPVYLAHLPVADNAGGGAQMVRVCGNLPNAQNAGNFYMLRSYHSSAHEIWNVTDPSHPIAVHAVIPGVAPTATNRGNPLIGDQTGGANKMASTHKSFWECSTGIAYVVGSRGTDAAAGWKTGHHIMLYDLSNPEAANPRFIRDWTLDGQQPGADYLPQYAADHIAPAIHGPVSIGPGGVGAGVINRVYFAYGVGDHGVMQVADRSKLLDPNIPTTDFMTPEITRWYMNPDNGGHTSWPLGKIAVTDFMTGNGNDKGTMRDIVVVTSEATGNFCSEVRHMTYLVDVTTPDLPQGISTFMVPAESGMFCDVGGRFGPHATNEEFGPPFYQKLVFISYFNAGVRAVDVRDPYNPKEVAFYIPSTTANTDLRCGPYRDKRCAAQDHSDCVCKKVIQTNNVATDDRGYVYIVDRANTGMHILQLTGDAAAIAGLPH